MSQFADLNIVSFGDERHSRAVLKASQQRKVRRLSTSNQDRVYTTLNGVLMPVSRYVEYDHS